MIENRLVPCRRCGPREIFEAPDYPEFHLVLYLIVNLKNEYEMNSIVNQFMLIKKIGWDKKRAIQIYWIYSSRSRSISPVAPILEKSLEPNNNYNRISTEEVFGRAIFIYTLSAA